MESQKLTFFSYCSALKKDMIVHCVQPSTWHRWGRNTIVNVGIHCVVGTQPHVIASVGLVAALASVIHDFTLQMLVTLENNVSGVGEKPKYDGIALLLHVLMSYAVGNLFNRTVLPFAYLQILSMRWRGEELSGQQLRDRSICFFLVT